MGQSLIVSIDPDDPVKNTEPTIVSIEPDKEPGLLADVKGFLSHLDEKNGLGKRKSVMDDPARAEVAKWNANKAPKPNDGFAPLSKEGYEQVRGAVAGGARPRDNDQGVLARAARDVELKNETKGQHEVELRSTIAKAQKTPRDRTTKEKFSDAGVAVAQGAATLGAGMTWLAKAGANENAKTEWLDDLQEKANSASKFWADKKSEPIKQQIQYLEDQEGFIDNMKALGKHPALIVDLIGQSAAMVIPGLGLSAIGGKAGQMAINTKLAKAAMAKAGMKAAVDLSAKGASFTELSAGIHAAQREVAKQIISNPATAAAILGEGMTSAAVTGQDVEQFVNKMDFDKLSENPRFVELATKMSPEAARKKLAMELSRPAALKAGTWTSFISKVTGAGKFMGSVGASTERLTAGGAVKGIAKSSVEEGMQNPGEDFVAYQGKVQVDPKQSFDPGASAAQGLVAGAGQGGGISAAGAISQSAASVWEQVTSGKVDAKNPVSQAAAFLHGKGAIQSPEQVQSLEKDINAIRSLGLDDTTYQSAMRGIVKKYLNQPALSTPSAQGQAPAQPTTATAGQTIGASEQLPTESPVQDQSLFTEREQPAPVEQDAQIENAQPQIENAPETSDVTQSSPNGVPIELPDVPKLPKEAQSPINAPGMPGTEQKSGLSEFVNSTPQEREAAAATLAEKATNRQKAKLKSAEQPVATMADGRIAVRGLPKEKVAAVRDKLGITGVVIGNNGNAIFPKDTNAIDLKRELGVDTGIPEGTILKNGRPFQKRSDALLTLNSDKALKKTHIIVPVEGGYGISPKAPPSASEVEAKTKKKEATAKKRSDLAKARGKVNYDNDSILAAVAKSGGLFLDDAQDISAIGKKAVRAPNGFGVFGRYLTHKKGLRADDLLTKLKGDGYLPEDADLNDMFERIGDEYLAGAPKHFSFHRDMSATADQAYREAQDEEEATDQAFAEDLAEEERDVFDGILDAFGESAVLAEDLTEEQLITYFGEDNDADRKTESSNQKSEPENQTGGEEGTNSKAETPERRKDAANRRRVSELTPEELRRELLTDPLTGLPNRRAYEESKQLPVQIALDVDSLKFVNDAMGHEAGDELLKTFADALRGLDAYHLSGDEFMVQIGSDDEAHAAMEGVQKQLDAAILVVTLPNGDTITKKGIHFSYGTGQTRQEADRNLAAHKTEREANGLRAGRGQQPNGYQVNPKGQQATQDNSTEKERVKSSKDYTVADFIKAHRDKFVRIEGSPGSYVQSEDGLALWRVPKENHKRFILTKSVDEVLRQVYDMYVKPLSNVDAEANAASTSATEAQKKAGNYQKGHVTISGLDISIENPSGSRRRPEWPELKSHYGYIKGTVGKDKDHVDVFIKPGTAEDYSGQIFVVDQKNKAGNFDEHKVMLGWEDEKSARDGYLENYEKGWAGLGAITPFSMEEFKAWLKNGDTKKPATFSLTGETEAEIRAREAAEKAAKDKEAADEKMAADAVKKADDEKSIASRQESSSRNFQLGQSQEDAIAGQGEIGSAQTAGNIGDGDPGGRRSPLRQTAEHTANIDHRNGESNRIEDAGEKIGGARKDAWKERGLRASDLDNMSNTEAAGFATKDNVWPKIDYAKLIADGVEPKAAALIKVMRDRIAAKANKDTPEGRREYVEVLAIVAEKAKDIKTVEDASKLSRNVQLALGITEKTSPYSKEGRELLARLYSVYKGRKNPFYIGYQEGRKADEMLADGWPAKKEGAKRVNEDGEKIAPERPHLNKIERTGEDVRGGRNITAPDFINEFGFRGTEFGNWAAQDERQRSLNLAFEALHDLASVLGVPPKALSLNGTLGLAFGARGTRFAAHYEPGKLVINLAKLTGAGALAHEFGHALDHYFGEVGKSTAYEGSPSGISGWYKPPNGAQLLHLRHEMQDAFRGVLDAMFKRELTKAEAVRELELAIEKKEANLKAAERAIAGARNAKERRDWVRYSNDIKTRLNLNRARLLKITGEEKPKEGYGKVTSSYYESAKKLSGNSGERGYWARPTELFARAFEAYVFDKIKAGDRISQYLVQGVEADRYSDTEKYKANPYPASEEREKINAAFDKLFEVMESKETDKGIALFNTPAEYGDIGNAAPLYSQLAQAFETAKQDSMAASTWKAWLVSNAPKLGVKKDEITWSGITDFLDLHNKAKISKADILNFLSEEGVKVKTTVLGGEPQDFPRSYEDLSSMAQNVVDKFDSGHLNTVEFQEELNKFGYRADFGMGGELEQIYRTKAGEPAKFFNYVPPGGVPGTYREILITLPERISGRTLKLTKTKYGWKVLDENGKNVLSKLYMERAEAEQAAERITGESAGNFRSAHFAQPNILVHLRTDEATGADGKRYLRVIEVQSDWGQQGKKEGFKQKIDPRDVSQNIENAKDWLRERGINPEEDYGYVNEQNYVDLARSRGFQGPEPQMSGVQPAPFVTDTKAWVSLGIKKAIQQAVGNGVDGVIFASGQQNADLYDLSKKINELTWYESHGKYELSADGNVLAENVPVEKLNEYIGKDLAARIQKESESKDRNTYSGLDLKVGGEGMRHFYDVIVPSVANEVLKKAGGGKVEDITVGDSVNKGFLISDSTRATIQKDGLALFNTPAGYQSSQTETEAFKKWFGDSKVVDEDGRPLVVYHGTSTPSFTTFKRQRGGWSGGMGIWFGSHPDIANEFAKTRFADQGAAVYPVFLNIKNPRQYDGWDDFTAAARATGKAEIGDMQKSLRNSLIRKGYDGIVIRGSDTDNGGTRNDWVVFEPNQIKSAVGNRGTFDNNPNILSNKKAGYRENNGQIDLYERLEQRPGTTGLQRYTGRIAIREVLSPFARRAEGALLGSRIDKDFREHGGTELIGQTVRTGEDLALLAQILRDPRFETFRIFFTKNDQIIGHSGFTSRMPGMVQVVSQRPGESESDANKRFVMLVRDIMKNSDADGFWVLHNHPNGRAIPSGPDIGITKFIASKIPGFRGHVIIDHNEYGYIDAQGIPEIIQKNMGATRGGPELPHDMLNSNLGSPSDLVALAGKIKRKEGFFTLISRGHDAKVSAIAEFPLSLLSADKAKLLASLRRFARMTGSQDVFAVAPESFIRKFDDAVAAGWIEDAVADNARRTSHATVKKSRSLWDTGKARAMSANQKTHEYRSQNQLNLPGTPIQNRYEIRNKGNINMPVPAAQGKRIEVSKETKRDSLARGLQDKYRRLKTIQADVLRSGGKIEERSNPYLMEEIHHSKTALRLKNIDKNLFKPLEEAIVAARKKHAVTLKGIQEFLIALHAKERNEWVRSFDKENQSGSGMSDADAEAVIEKAKKNGSHDALMKISAATQKINEHNLNSLVEDHLEPAEYVEHLKRWKNYVPLKTVDENGIPGTGQGFSIGGKEFKRALGRHSEAGDVLENLMLQTERLAIRAEKNKVEQAFMNMVFDNPDPKLWTIEKTKYKRAIDKETGELTLRPDFGARNQDDVLSVKVSGETYLITVHDEKLVRAMKNLSQTQKQEIVDKVLSVASSINRYYALVYTALSPEFVVSNMARDLQTAFINMTADHSTKLAAKVIKDIPAAIRGSYRGIRDKAVTTEYQKWFLEYEVAGGKVEFFGLNDIAERRRHLDRLIKRADGSILLNSWDAAKAGLDYIMDLNGAVENATRVSVYANLRQAGYSKAQSASFAKNITVNFNRKGELGVFLNALYLFYNAATQGVARFAKTATSKRGAALLALTAIAGLALDALMRNIAPDDEDGKNPYDKALDAYGSRYVIIMRPDGSHYKWIMPYQYSLPFVVGQQLGAMANGQAPGKTFRKIIEAAITSFNPVGGADIAQAATPTIADPLMMMATNTGPFGNPLYPESDDPDSEAYFRSNTPESVRAARWLNSVTGGNEVRSGAIDIHPATIDLWFRTVTGGLGSMALNFRNLNEDSHPSKVPFLKLVYGKTPEWYDQKTYYENINELKTIKKELDLYANNEEKLSKIEANPKSSIVDLPRSFEREIKKINKEIKALRADESMDDDERNDQLKMLDAERRSVMREFNLEFNRAR